MPVGSPDATGSLRGGSRTPGPFDRSREYNAAMAVRAVSLAFACPACGAAVEGEMSPSTTSMTCTSCGASTDLPEAAGLASSRAADVCPVCGCTDMYQQRDFNRRV